jgi:hypothetical protein
MKKIVVKSIILCAISYLFYACSEKVDLQGPYEANAYIFGMLDATQDTQKIKIYKIFGGVGKSGAENIDSIYFKPGEIEAKIVSIKPNGQIGSTKFLNYANNSSLDPNGVFNPNNAVYYYTDKRLSSDSTYKVMVTIKSNDRKIESEPILMTDTCAIEPPPLNPPSPLRSFDGSLTLRNDYITNLDTQKIYVIRFKNARNIKGINGKIEFVYGNYNFQNLLQYKSRLSYNLNNISFSDQTANQFIIFEVSNVNLLKYWGANIPNTDPVITLRRPFELNFTFTYYNKEVETFNLTQNTSTGLSQDKIAYSNIKNGLGFVGARSVVTYFRQTLLSDTKLEKSNYTKKLMFKDF